MFEERVIARGITGPPRRSCLDQGEDTSEFEALLGGVFGEAVRQVNLAVTVDQL